jgi:hypothetical protein
MHNEGVTDREGRRVVRRLGREPNVRTRGRCLDQIRKFRGGGREILVLGIDVGIQVADSVSDSAPFLAGSLPAGDVDRVEVAVGADHNEASTELCGAEVGGTDDVCVESVVGEAAPGSVSRSRARNWALEANRPTFSRRNALRRTVTREST